MATLKNDNIDDIGLVSLGRFTGVSSFMRAPIAANAVGVDIALAGIPYDFQSGRGSAKLGPSQIREMSGLIRPLSFDGVAPFELCSVADVGDVALNPMDPRQ